MPPPPGIRSPALWGQESHLEALFGDAAKIIRVERKHFMFRYASADHFVDVFRRFYGPTYKTFGALDEQGKAALAGDIIELLDSYNRAGSDSLVVPGEYLEVVIEKW